MSSLCLCLTAPRFDDAVAQIEYYRSCIDMAEMRLDLLRPEERCKAASLPGIAGIPLILTIRLSEDGGKWGDFGENELDRAALFETMLESGTWTYIDLENNKPLPTVVAAAATSRTRIIRSIHDFTGNLLNRTPRKLAETIRTIADDGSIPKIAARCTGSRQLLTLAQTAVATETVKDKILLGMGEYGVPSRILANRFGSLWTYTSAIDESGEPESAAPGQLDPETLAKLYRFNEINASSILLGIAGDPVAHSQSPILHNRWLQKAGLNGTYIPIRSDDIGALMEACDIWGFKGLSVTVPHKETALLLCNHVGLSARNIGATNTLIRTEDGWRGKNTDADGFLKPLPQAMNLKSVEELQGKNALVIGAGGAARAVVHALSKSGMNLVILNRTVRKARRLARENHQRWGSLSQKSVSLLEGGIDLAVQTTNVGMHPDNNSDPIPWWNPQGCSLAYDIVYNPEETVFLTRCRTMGIKTLNGSGMLEAQARIQFELFTGKKAPD